MAPIIDPLVDEEMRREAQAAAPNASGATFTQPPPAKAPTFTQPAPLQPGGTTLMRRRTAEPAPRNPAIDQFYEDQNFVSPRGNIGRVGTAYAEYAGGVGERGGATVARGAGGKVETYSSPEVQSANTKAQEEATLKRAARSKQEGELLASGLKQRRDDQASAATAREGLGAREILALQRLKQGAQRQLGAVRTRETQMQMPAGTVVRGLPGTESQQVESDWKVVFAGMKPRVAESQTLAEYDQNFNEIRNSVGPAAAQIQDTVRNDYLASMPPQVRAEYQQRQMDLKNAAEATRAAQAERIRTIARATVAAVGGKTVGQLLAEQVGRETQEREMAKGDAEEALEVKHGVVRRKREKEQEYNTALARGQAAEKVASDSAGVRRARKKEDIIAEGEAKETVAKATFGSELDRAQKLAKSKTVTTETTKRQLESLYGPNVGERLSNMRMAYGSAEKQYNRADKEYRDAIEPKQFKVGDDIITKPPDAQKVARLKAARDESFKRMRFYEHQFQQIADVSGPEGQKPSVGRVRTTTQADAELAYDRKFAELAEDGISSKDMKLLDSMWAATGRKDEESRHTAVRYEAPPDYSPGGDTEQTAGISPAPRYENGPDGMVIPQGMTPKRLAEDYIAGRVNRETAIRIRRQMGW